jgi:hypothetical protein
MPEPEGFQPERGGLELAEGRFTSPAEIPHGCIFDRGNIDGWEST